MAWSTVAYQRMLRYSLDKPRLSWGASFFQLFWHLFIISVRMLVIALFASHFGKWIGFVLFLHFIVMCVWLSWQETKFKFFKNCVIVDFFFYIALSFVYIFHFLNIRDGHTRLRYLFYYSLIFVENTVLISFWYINVSSDNMWFSLPILIYTIVGFFIGVFFQLIYYKYFHPKCMQIKLCLTCKELLNRKSPDDIGEIALSPMI